MKIVLFALCLLPTMVFAMMINQVNEQFNDFIGTFDMEGKTKVGFTAKGKINRKDFGMPFDAPVSGDGLLVGNDVDIMLDIEAFEEK